MGNYIASNHIVATTDADEQMEASDSCYSAQVNALTSTDQRVALDVIAVQVDRESIQNTVLDSGSDKQVLMDRGANAFRGTPTLGAPIA